MRRNGICQKCGKETIVQDHHKNGYGETHKDDVVPYCCSCDLKAHAKARREGKCKLISHESRRLSHRSVFRRSCKQITFTETMEPYVRLFEIITINNNTGRINLNTYFRTYPGKRILFIDENQK